MVPTLTAAAMARAFAAFAARRGVLPMRARRHHRAIVFRRCLYVRIAALMSAIEVQPNISV